MNELFPSPAAGMFGRRLKRARGHRIPVTVVTGFLGAGKTTLLRRFLGDAGGARHRGGGQRIRRDRHRRRAGALERRRNRAARQWLPVLHHAHRSATGAAPHGDRARARRIARLQAHRDRDQRARRSVADPADLRHRPRARRGVPRRGGGDRGRRGSRRRHARLVVGGAPAGDPGRPAGDHQDRHRRRRRRRSARARNCARSIRAPRSSKR